MGRKDGVSLKKHFEAIRRADQVAIKLDRRWTRERLRTHNDLLNKWQAATDKDRESFARKDALDALRAEFATYKEITAKALTLAEGKSKGFDAVRAGISFMAGLVIALITTYALFKNVR